MLIILFGLTGTGKNFVGDILEKNFGFKFWDADEALSPEMVECIKHHKSWTLEMRQNYFQTIKIKIKSLLCENQNIAIAQAFYKDIYRDEIISEYPEALWLQIQAQYSLNINRVKERYAAGKSPVDEKYAKQIIGFFDPPSCKFMYANIENNGDRKQIIKQLKNLLGSFYSPHFFKVKEHNNHLPLKNTQANQLKSKL